MTALIPDLEQRQAALDITRSFIVQAPAGSGKTELLTQRFLQILANAVREPEEIIAVTFTRKAAAEMRSRIIMAIADESTEIAIRVKNRDQELHWRLSDNPSRLRIMTIDAICLYLVQQMPLHAKFNAGFSISEHPLVFYNMAVQNLLLLHQDALKDSLTQLLLHLDNDVARLSDLLVNILQHRDQWLPHVFGLDAIHELEQALQHVIDEQHQKLLEAIPESCKSDFMLITQYVNEDNNIACLFVTDKGDWRKRIPSEIPKEHKAALKNLIESFSQYENLREMFVDMQYAPSPHYREDQKKLLESLAAILPTLVAELQLVFVEHQQCDFTEIAMRALQALGEENNPTNLALHLDYQLKHLLVDEFQDTSITQLRLIEKLTTGWLPSDGKTLFLVGDPMQSIYRFRKAEVGLFLQVQQRGINQVPLTSLTLTSNFRATDKMVAWLNTSFSKIFPEQSDLTLGAITYSASHAMLEGDDHQTIFTHQHGNSKTSPQTVIAILQKTWQEDSLAKIAILVRARQHLSDIIIELRQAHIPFRAVEIASLQDEPIIQDLFALTRALCHHADRIAWLAVLRAPWCGLTLQDLHTLCADEHHQTLWELMHGENSQKLSDDGKKRIGPIINVLQWSVNQRGRLTLREWVEQTWLKLNGPALLAQSYDLTVAKNYFDLLNRFSFDVEMTHLEKQLTSLTAPADPDPSIKLELMTIHKAKGLEFDVVILPALEKTTRADSAKLFLWAERINISGFTDLLVAPIKSAREKEDSIYCYLKHEEAKRSRYECQRLLYVATTRAKKVLHLLFSQSGENVSKNSLLSHLQPVLPQDGCSLSENEKSNEDAPVLPQKNILKRIKITDLSPVSEMPNVSSHDNSQYLLTIDQLLLREQGTKIHRLLQQVGDGHRNLPAQLEKNPRAQWIFHPTHKEAHNEYALTGVLDNEIFHVILDRTFVDETNRRWIIDYKYTECLDVETYRPQLEKYAKLMRLCESREIWLGLFSPLSYAWVEWRVLF